MIMVDATTLPLSPDPQKMISQLARLVEISLTLNSTLKLEPLLQYILDTAAELLECEAVSILLFDEESKELKFAAATGSDPKELAKIPVPLDSSIAGTIFTENKPLLISNVQQDPRHYNQVGEQTQFQVSSLLGVPMRIRKKNIGVLEALNKRYIQFTDTDTKLLSIIASQAAVAINNARLVIALQNANEQLNETDKIKSDFMAIASHELRTPLGIILGYATFLKEESQGELSEFANQVLNAALQIQALVEDMGNLNLLNTGKADLNFTILPLQKLLRNAYKQVVSTAEAKNDNLILQLPDDPVMVNADSKLESVFVNLLNNAVRFTTDPDDIIIRLTTNDDQAIIEVQDNGIGISPEKLERIFDEFYQVDDHMTRRYEGMGLGLAIARALVENHGGRIWAESTGPGEGATFKVTLPRITA